ncbi:MAG: 50S ribosomal protein L28 [Firmicutes bacterium]|nr:50S ribosomal protein L28 [Bacillota bacterium]
MSRECDICGKSQMTGNQVKRQSQWVLRRTNTQKQPNLQPVTMTTESGNTVRVKACTKCIKKMKSE